MDCGQPYQLVRVTGSLVCCTLNAARRELCVMHRFERTLHCGLELGFVDSAVSTERSAEQSEAETQLKRMREEEEAAESAAAGSGGQSKKQPQRSSRGKDKKQAEAAAGTKQPQQQAAVAAGSSESDAYRARRIHTRRKLLDSSAGPRGADFVRVRCIRLVPNPHSPTHAAAKAVLSSAFTAITPSFALPPFLARSALTASYWLLPTGA
jgi:hypothetical protein